MTHDDAGPSVASGGSQGDPLSVCCRHLANSQTIIERKNAEIERLRLTATERGALERAASWLAKAAESRKELHSAGYLCEDAAVLRSILERFN